jgi:hypothetical protein
MKLKRKLLVMGLAFTMVLGTAATAFAAWPSYQGESSHNGVLSSAPVNIASGFPKSATLQYTGSGWSGVDNTPVMYKAEYTDASSNTSEKVLAYILYNGRGDGARLACYDSAAAAELWNIQLDTSSKYQLSTPCLDESGNCIYVASNGNIYKISGINTASPTKQQIFSGANGEINTPITKYGNYIYFGSWVSNGTISGAAEPGSYYQLDTTSSINAYKEYQSTGARGFYWAGAYSDGSNVYFGGDDGRLYIRSVNNFDTSGSVVLLTDTVSTAGNVRSSIMAKAESGTTSLYFTSQGGYLWKYTIGASDPLKYANIGSTSTSTPVMSDNDILYVGCYGTAAQGVKALASSDFTANITSSTDSKWKTVYADTSSTATDKVQASVVAYSSTYYDEEVYEDVAIDYVYFTTNASAGAGYCYSFVPSTGAAASVWSTEGSTYTLQGMAGCDGYLVFGNDYNKVYFVK